MYDCKIDVGGVIVILEDLDLSPSLNTVNNNNESITNNKSVIIFLVILIIEI